VHTESEEILVIYVCAVSGMIFCRPKAMFDEIVKTDTYSGPRFIALPETKTKEERKSLKWFE
jgi:hypothetical protein